MAGAVSRELQPRNAEAGLSGSSEVIGLVCGFSGVYVGARGSGGSILEPGRSKLPPPYSVESCARAQSAGPLGMGPREHLGCGAAGMRPRF